MSEEWWHPQLTDAAWVERVRADYPERTASMSDHEVRATYADGRKYQTTWDHLGDARSEHEALADNWFALRAALRAVLLFYHPGLWDQEQRITWGNLTQHGEATTKVLCDTVRKALGEES